MHSLNLQHTVQDPRICLDSFCSSWVHLMWWKWCHGARCPLWLLLVQPSRRNYHGWGYWDIQCISYIPGNKMRFICWQEMPPCVNPTHLYNLIQGLIVVYLTRTINTTIFAAVSSISSHSSPNTRNTFFFPSQRIHSFKFSKVGIQLNIGCSKRELLNIAFWTTPNLLKNSFRVSCKSILAQIKCWSVFIPMK